MTPSVLVVLAAGRARRYGGVKPLAPVGPAGEAVIDLLGSDAAAAGFTRLVLVIGPATGPAIRYHVERTWPTSLDYRFAVQDRPLGTVHAVLAAVEDLAPGAGFGACNADDLYGESALRLLAGHLEAGGPGGPAENALIGFRLANAVVGDSPVTRGVCRVDGDGRLEGVDERRSVTATAGGRFVSADGHQPAELDGSSLVSMNLWGFVPGMVNIFKAAMMAAGEVSEEAEVLLPEVVDQQLRLDQPPGGPFRVLPTQSRCIGVTHPDDLALVQADIARQVGTGQRPALLWGAGG